MTRQAAPVSPPVVLSIAGSDSGGGAGIQADCKTIEACGGFATTAITAVTAQNTAGVERTHGLPVGEIEAQCRVVQSDFDVRAIKTGMLATGDVIEMVTDQIRDASAPAVVDPVMVAASGDRLLESDAEAAYEQLVAEARLATPNAGEAAVLTGIEPKSEREARQAGERLLEMGAEAALVTGGHVPGEQVADVLVTAETVETYRHERVDTDATHGSGCTLSSAIATYLAHGDDLTDAVSAGIDLLSRAVRYTLDVGAGPGAVHHLVSIRNDATRGQTAETVEWLLERFVDADVRALVPETGTNVVGATPYAERADEIAAVDGGLNRTGSGVRATRGVRFGASGRVAATLLAAREIDPALRYCVTWRYDDAIADALAGLDGSVAEIDGALFEVRGDADGTAGSDGQVSTDPARPAPAEAPIDHDALAEAMGAVDGRPVAVVDAEGPRAPTVTMLATDAETLAERTLTISEGQR